MIKRLAALVMVLLVASGLQVTTLSPASAATSEATFNTPDPWGNTAANYRIFNKVVKTINAVPGWSPNSGLPRPIIHISTYFLDKAEASNALIEACKRRVSVRVILDSGITDKPAKQLITALNADNVADADKDGQPDSAPKTGPCNTKLPTNTPTNPGARTAAPDLGKLPEVLDADEVSTSSLQRSVTQPDERSVTWGSDDSYVRSCKGSCRGGGGAMHAKFFLFNYAGALGTDITMVSSANLNGGGAGRGWNDMVTFEGRPALRSYFAQMHREMTEDDRTNQGRKEFTDGDVTARFFPIRGAGKSTDPTLQDLNKIKCTSALGRTQIKISMFYWAHDRGLYLADKIIALGKAGCSVQVIYGAPGKDVQNKLMAAAKKGTIQLWDSRHEKLPDGDYQTRTHGKFFTVKGTFGTNNRAYLTVTGSQNWAGSSLSAGDEVTMNMGGSAMHNAFVANWGRIKSHSRRVR